MATVPDNCACVPAMLRPPDTCADDFGDRHPRRLEKAVPAGRLDGLCFCPDGPVPGAVVECRAMCGCGRSPCRCLLADLGARRAANLEQLSELHRRFDDEPPDRRIISHLGPVPIAGSLPQRSAGGRGRSVHTWYVGLGRTGSTTKPGSTTINPRRDVPRRARAAHHPTGITGPTTANRAHTMMRDPWIRVVHPFTPGAP